MLLIGALAVALAGAPGNIRASGQAVTASRAETTNVVTIPVSGMACFSCAAAVKKTVRAIDGVSDVEVALAQATVRVTYAPSRVSPERVVSAINRLGYRAGTPVDGR
jgi:copper chaperone CopZ